MQIILIVLQLYCTKDPFNAYYNIIVGELTIYFGEGEHRAQKVHADIWFQHRPALNEYILTHYCRLPNSKHGASCRRRYEGGNKINSLGF
jgi:hypothetical protein